MSSVAEAVILASGAQTTTQTLDPLAVATAQAALANIMGSPDILEVVVDTTVFGTGSVTVSIQEFDIAAGSWANVLASAAIVAVGRVRLVIGPTVPTVANVSQTMGVPKRWRVVATANNANSQTYSISVRASAYN